jgi:hypothetical protein
MQIVQQGWHPVRLDTAQMASNADLIAIKGKQRVSIQVKTTNAETQHGKGDAAGWLSFGYATGYLRDKKPIFNSKNSPLIADVVIAVKLSPAENTIRCLARCFCGIPLPSPLRLLVVCTDQEW